MATMTPRNVQLLEDEGSEERGEMARMSAFIGAVAIGDLVKTTLGPKGMDKILISASHQGEVSTTNDGATILKSLFLDNPAAKVLVEISKTQDDEVGDGTTSVTVLAAELLREAEKMVDQKLHPQTIIDGWRLAQRAALDALEKSAVDHGKDPVLFKEDLMNIARTTLSSKVLNQERDHFARLAVDAVLRLKGSTSLDSIHIIKKQGGSLADSFLEEGFILEKRIGVGQPKRIENPKIMIANTAMDTDKIKIFGSRVRVDSTAKLAEIETAERTKMLDKCQRIVDHGVNVFINRQLIYNAPEQFFADRGVMAIEHADFEGIERLSLVLGAEIASTFDHPGETKLGTCELIEEFDLDGDMVIRFSGVPVGAACTVVLRGATHNLIDEAERSLHDALCVISQTIGETRTILGAGCAETLMARAVEDAARLTPGKKALAMEAYARALRMLPTIIADNAGFDSGELVAQLRAEHHKGNNSAGLDMRTGEIGDVRELGIVESYKVKHHVVMAATEAAEMILRVDEIIRTAPRRREQGHY